MKKLMLLAAVMAALVMLASASIAATYGGASDQDGNVAAPQSDAASAPAAPQQSAAPQAPDPELVRQSQELKVAQGQLEQAQREGDQAGVNTWRPIVEHQTEVVRERVVSVMHVPITRGDLIPVLRKMGLWGPTSGWAKGEVATAYAKGRMVGDHDGATAADEQGRRPATRQELATVGNRIAKEDSDAMTAHANWDGQEHQELWAAIRNNQMWRWIIPACLAALLLLLLLAIICRWRRRGNNNGLGNQAGWAQQGNGATASALNLSAAGETRSLGRN